ncbi:MAG: hypothetical protein NC388_04275 [Clostridium sp.]|nr:hypothetical protein [Clostridium sp.]
MRKFTFLAVMLLLIGWGSAWAQAGKLIPSQLTNGKYIAIKGIADNNTNWVQVGAASNATYSQEFAFEIVYNDEETAFALRKVKDGENGYIQQPTGNGSAAVNATLGAKNAAAWFTAAAPSNVPTGLASGVDASDPTTIRLTTATTSGGETYLNVNNTGSGIRFVNGPGNWSVCNLYEIVVYNCGSKIKETSRLVEGQTYLVKAVGSRSGWAFAGQTNPSYVFLNNANDLVLSTMGEMYLFRIEGDANSFKMKTSDGRYFKEAGLTTTESEASTFSLVAKSNAEAGIWNFKLSSNGNYIDVDGLGELAEENANYKMVTWHDANGDNNKWEIYPVNLDLPVYTITYNVKDANGNKLGESGPYQVMEGDPYPTVQDAASGPQFFTVPTGVVTASGTFDATIVETLPFAVSTIDGAYDSNVNWHTLTIRSTKYPSYNSTTGKVDNLTAQPDGVSPRNVFAFTGNVFDGFKIYNGGAGANKKLYVTNTNKEHCVFTAEGATFGLRQNTNSGYQFKLLGTTDTHLNDINDVLGVWTDKSSAADAGGTFTFTQVEFDIADSNVMWDATVNYTVDGVVVKTVTADYDPEGNLVAPVDFVTLGTPDVDQENNTVNIPCTYELPFTPSESFETATWYAMDIHSYDTEHQDVLNGTSAYLWTYVATDEDIITPKYATADINGGYFSDVRRWAFVGDPFNGFKIYNKEAGSSVTLRKATNGDSPSVMSATDDNNVFFLYRSAEPNKGGFAWKRQGDTNYINTRTVNGQKTLRGYTSADGGSSCHVFEIYSAIPTKTFYHITDAQGRSLTTSASGSNMELVADGTDDLSTVFYFGNERRLLSYKSGLYAYNVCRIGDVGQADIWTVKKAGNDGDGYTFLSDGQKYLAAGENAATESETHGANDGVVWTVERLTSLPVAVSAAKWASFCAPVALTIPDGVKVYYAKSVTAENNVLVMEELTGTIPADLPVLLSAEKDTYYFPIAAENPALPDGVNTQLKGTTAKINIDNGTSYVLAMLEGRVAFGVNNTGVVPGFKAYLQPENATTASAFSIRFDEFVTGIEGVAAATSDKAVEYYDLSGRRVYFPTRGIYVTSRGEKVFIK